MIILKVGGSLFEEAPALLGRIADVPVDLLIVPGGGKFADMVRHIDREKGLTAEAAHWMAVLAMEEYACYLSDKSGVKLSASLSQEKGVHIVLPYEILKANDELPHSWDVTSDTIAAWIALKLNSPLIKATDVDGIVMDGKLMERVEASRLLNIQSCVDKALPIFLIEHHMDAFVVNGKHADRVEKAIMGKPTTGTTIIGK
jgi:5-(aminomethyl)-3-furanmethanol phosphate kinase